LDRGAAINIPVRNEQRFGACVEECTGQA
jgi:hypothetical protein